LISLNIFINKLLGYPLTRCTIRPFADHDLTNNAAKARRRKKWNVKLSSARVHVEHAVGRLKGRFRILRNIPGYDIDQVYKTVESLLILHNILEELGDDPDTIEGFNGEEDDDVREVLQEMRATRNTGDVHSKDDLFHMGLLRRKHLVDLAFPL
jgi:hypothetical protein